MQTMTAPPPQRITINTPMPTLNREDQQTVGQFILAQLNAGVDPRSAAMSAGITYAEYGAWIRQGDILNQRVAVGDAAWETLPASDQDLVHWVAAARRAHGEHIARLTVVSEQIARGGIVSKTTRTTKDSAGNITGVVETSTQTPPDPAMVRWKLENLAPDTYGRSSQIDVTVFDGTDTESMQDLVRDRMLEVGRLLPPDPIDVDDGDPKQKPKVRAKRKGGSS